MIMTATIQLTPLQLREIITQYCNNNGVKGVSHQDIDFIVQPVEKGDQRDSWTTYDLTGITIKNVKIQTKE